MVIQMMRAIRAASIGNRPIGRSSFSSSTTRLLSTITPPAQFYVPKSERTLERPAFQIDYMVGETRLARNSRTCPTRDLNFTNVQWGRHKSPYRKWRHMINLFRAAPFQRLLFPDLACIAGLSASLTFFNEFLVTGQDALTMISISPATFAGATTAISILAGFRLNASYGRYREGRQYWSVVNTATRDLARQSYLWIANPNINTTNSELTQAQIRMLRLCQAFPVALLFHVNDKGGHHNMRRRSKAGEAPFKDRVLAEFRAELEDVYYYTKHDDDTNAMLQEDLECIIRIKAQGGNAPLEIITCMGDIIGQCSRHSENPVHPVYIHQLDCQVQQLCKALGSCERIGKCIIRLFLALLSDYNLSTLAPSHGQSKHPYRLGTVDIRPVSCLFGHIHYPLHSIP